MDRAERRRQERAGKKQPVIIAGDGMIAQALGEHFEARPSAQLPTKVKGQHRWIATAAFIVNPDQARDAMNEKIPKFMDHENLFHMGIGCWDCEQPIHVIGVDSTCPATEWTD